MSLDPVTAVVELDKTTNQTDAINLNIFVSGWRPFIGWVCGFAYAWNWIGLPVVRTVAALLGYTVELSSADLSEMTPVLLAMLGLGTLRTVEKIQKVASK